MQRQGVAHIAQVTDHLLIWKPSESQVMSTNVASRVGRLDEAVDGHNRKQLAQGPVVEQRLKDGEIAKVLVAEAVFELANFIGNVSLAGEALDDLEADLPVKVFDLGFVRQFKQAQHEHLVGIVLPLPCASW